jgi:hypothetical protein
MRKELERFPSLNDQIRMLVEDQRTRNRGRPVSHRLRRYIADLVLARRLAIIGRVARSHSWDGNPKDFVLALGLPNTTGQRKKIGKILAAWAKMGVLEKFQSRRRPRYRFLERVDTRRYLGWVEANRAKADCDGVLADLGYPLEGHPWPFTVERLPSPGTEGHVRVMDGWPDPVMSDTPSAYVINGSPLQMLVEGGFAYPEEVQEVEAAVRVVNRGLHLWDRRVRHRELTLLGQSRGFFLPGTDGKDKPAGEPPSIAALRTEFESLPRVGSVLVSRMDWPEISILPLLRDFSIPLEVAGLSLASRYDLSVIAATWLNPANGLEGSSVVTGGTRRAD